VEEIMFRRSRLVVAFLFALLLTVPYVFSPGSVGAVSCGPCPATVTEDLNLRAEPSTDADVLVVMPAGADVEWDPLEEESDGFVAVTYDGESGWAYRDYLLLFPAAATTTTDLNLREDDNYDAEVLLVIPSGADVTVLGDAANGFYSVRYDETAGYAAGEFLSFESSPPEGDGFPAGTAIVVATDGLNLRDEPGLGGEVLDVVPYGVEGEVIEPSTEADGYVWYHVELGSGYGTGWVAAEFLSYVEAGGDFSAGDEVVVIDGALNYRADPSIDAEVIKVLPDGTEGAILDGPVYADGWTWYQLGLPGYGPDGEPAGWVAAEYLAAT
jgi:uncharacterized protein YgiM (DUF1202 family)